MRIQERGERLVVEGAGMKCVEIGEWRGRKTFEWNTVTPVVVAVEFSGGLCTARSPGAFLKRKSTGRRAQDSGGEIGGRRNCGIPWAMGVRRSIEYKHRRPVRTERGGGSGGGGNVA